MVLLAYPTICRKTLQTFDCVTLRDESYLWRDPSIRCDGAEWQAWAVWSSLSIVVYCLGAPAFLFWLAHRYRNCDDARRQHIALLVDFGKLLVSEFKNKDRASKLALQALQVLERQEPVDEDEVKRVEKLLRSWDKRHLSLSRIHTQLEATSLSLARRYLEAELPTVAADLSWRLGSDLGYAKLFGVAGIPAGDRGEPGRYTGDTAQGTHVNITEPPPPVVETSLSGRILRPPGGRSPRRQGRGAGCHPRHTAALHFPVRRKSLTRSTRTAISR